MPVSNAYYADVTQLVQALHEAPQRMETLREKVLDDIASDLLSEQTATVPVASGKLKASLGVESRTMWRRIGADDIRAPHGVFVEFGTKPHTISPKNGKALAFQIKGQSVVVKRVNHPGTRPQPFAANSLRRWREALVEQMLSAGVEAINV